ncbi:SDR family oxidoreductase [Sphingomonas crocodyli]|uniref:SDR family oxidoreductase n=1 Tax=Sphingomonas crocodyli TaxID=1979270 RepID=A0A437M647_9SPHN|nr:SDR family oxidoreductase [Sphingomonas crocodyli]RVT93119.1 SDR family oxidoreductase [Sphingomonas crocodyli]
MLLEGKVIILSGVGPGLGRVLALRAAREGAAIGLGTRTQDQLDQLQCEIEAEGGRVIAVSTDVTDPDQCRRLAEVTETRFGRIDGLVASAYAPGDWKRADEADPGQLAALFDTSCAGTLRMAQACLPALKASRGAIVSVSTMSVVNPFPGEVIYAAAKSGLGALTRHMAADFGQYGIRANLARMGWMAGPAVKGFIDAQVTAGRDRDAVVNEINARIPLGVIPPLDDCAPAILFLVSDHSRMVTGASLDINGGQYMAP